MKLCRPPVQDITLWRFKAAFLKGLYDTCKAELCQVCTCLVRHGPGHLLPGLAGPAKAAFGHCPAAGAEVFASAAPRVPVCPCSAPHPSCLRVCCCGQSSSAPAHLGTGDSRVAWEDEGEKAGRKETQDKTRMTVLGKWPCHQCWSVIFVLGKLCIQGELDRASGRL